MNDWFRSTLQTRLDNPADGVIVVVMQRFHKEDPTGFLLSQGGWRHLKLPAIAPEDIDVPLSASRAHHWKAGEPLHEARLPVSELNSFKQALGTDAFNAQFLQEPVPPSGNMIKRDWLQFFDIAPALLSGDEIIQSWDTANKATDTSDYTACLTFRVRNRNEYHLIDVYRDRPEFPELAKLVVSHASKYQASTILIEDKGSGTQLIQTVRSWGLQGVVSWTPTMDKITRMQGQTPKLEARSLWLPRSALWLADFLAECLSFPSCRYKDQMDALSQFLEWQGSRGRDFIIWHSMDDVDEAPSPEEMLYRRGRY